MPFYNKFLSRWQDIPFIRKIRFVSEIAICMKWIDQFWDKSFFKFLAYGLGKGHFIKAVSELQREYVAVGRGLTIIKRLRNPGYGVIEAFVLPIALNLPDYGVV